MGLFLSMSGVIGKSKAEVAKTLKDYSISKSGGLEEKDLNHLDKNFCALCEGQNGTTIFYPYSFMAWDESAIFISKKLTCPTFSFHIHDGDFWLFTLYHNGELMDQFNPIPDYWNENITEEEIEQQRGNPNRITDLIKGVKVEQIANYFQRWDLDAESTKAYLEDEFENEDWQVLDFMKKIGLEYPLSDPDNPKGTVYEFWTRD